MQDKEKAGDTERQNPLIGRISFSEIKNWTKEQPKNPTKQKKNKQPTNLCDTDLAYR